MEDSGELMDIQQAAAFLQVSQTSLRRWTNEGRLACLRVGRRRERRFRRADLVAFMEAQPAAHAAASFTETGRREHVVIGGLPVALVTHLCGLYDNDRRRATMAADFLDGGNRHGVAGVMMVPPEAAADIAAELGRRSAVLEAAVAAGRVKVGDPGDSPESLAAAAEQLAEGVARSGAHVIRLVGDAWFLKQRLGSDGLRDFERGFSERLRGRLPLVTMCLYDVRRFTGSETLEALRLHRDSFSYPLERWLG